MGSYSHFLDTKSFIYNSGLGADWQKEKDSDTKESQTEKDEIQEKRDGETEENHQQPLGHQAVYPGALYSPYISPAWYLPVRDQRSLAPAQEDVYKREADLNGAPYPHLGLGVPPGVAPLYGYPYFSPAYYSAPGLQPQSSLHHHQPPSSLHHQPAGDRAAVPVYVPASPAPAPVYRSGLSILQQKRMTLWIKKFGFSSRKKMKKIRYVSNISFLKLFFF